jgi:hypothetical protein
MNFTSKKLLKNLVYILAITPRQTSSLSNTMNKAPQKISIRSAGFQHVNGIYQQKSPTLIPAGFDRTCRAMNWNTEQMWTQLSDQCRPWYEAENESYVYWNRGDGKWWIDGPSGAGIFIVKNDGWFPPKSGWIALDSDYEPLPEVTPISMESSSES